MSTLNEFIKMKYRVLFDGFDLHKKVFNTFEEAEAYRLDNLNSCEYASWVAEIPH